MIKKLAILLFIIVLFISAGCAVVNKTDKPTADNVKIETQEEPKLVIKNFTEERKTKKGRTYKINVEYAQIEGDIDKNIKEKYNNLLKEMAMKGIEDIDNTEDIDNMTPPEINYIYEVTCKTGECENNIFSVLYTIYHYAGGAHGTISLKSLTFDYKTGKELSLDDIIDQNQQKSIAYYIMIVRELANDLESSMSFGRDYYLTEAEAKSLINDETNFFLNHNNIVIAFEPYEIGPFSTGVVEFSFSKNLFNNKSTILPENIDIDFIRNLKEMNFGEIVKQYGLPTSLPTFYLGGISYTTPDAVFMYPLEKRLSYKNIEQLNFSAVYLNKKGTKILGIEIGKDTLEDALKKLRENQDENIYKIGDIYVNLEEDVYEIDVHTKDGITIYFSAKDKSSPISQVFINLYH